MKALGATLRKLFDTTPLLKRIALFVGWIFVAIWLYNYFISDLFSGERSIALSVIAFWFLFAYVVVPRLHRFLTSIYLPDYYIGRSRTGDGLLGDPVNIAINGTQKDIERAMKAQGWIEADDLNAASTFKMIKYSLLRRSYPSAPVSSLFLFNKKQDFAFQQEVGGSTKKRHHVRFWKCPEGWMLPGGYTADYLAAATYDRSVGLSLYTLQITHKIEEDIDIERDYVVESLRKGSRRSSVKVVKNYATGYHTRNGGGDTIRTDGDLPFVTIGKS